MGNVKVQYIDTRPYERVIAVSDLHGDYDGFLRLLKQTAFSSKDALVIVGDILEKGSQSLKLLRAVMECVKAGNTYMVAGNNDLVLEEWYHGEIDDEDVWNYMCRLKHSVLIDMANEVCAEWKSLEIKNPIKVVKERIWNEFQAEIQFLEQLPHIMESDEAIFVHAGITPEPLKEQELHYCLTAQDFGEQTHRFAKPVVVGHWPVSNYPSDKIRISSHFNKETNVISIDGGNSLKSWRQINYLVFENGKIEDGYVDQLPKIEVLEHQEESKEWITLTFPDTMVDVIQKGDENSLCYVPFLQKNLTIENTGLYPYKGKMYCFDVTTYQMGLEVGEVVSYCKEKQVKIVDESTTDTNTELNTDTKDTKNHGIMVKRDGIVGIYKGIYRICSEDRHET